MPKLLLIEDNDIDVELVRRIVKRYMLDIPIVRANNGVEALEILNRPSESGLSQPFIVLLDINMPMMNGFEFLDHLTHHGPDLDVPIYILSTSDSELDRSKSSAYKITGFLVKPLAQNVLAEILESSSTAKAS